MLSKLELNKISFWHKLSFFLVVFSIPFFRVATSIPLILFTITTILFYFFNHSKKSNTSKYKSWVLICLIFFLASLTHHLIFLKTSDPNSLSLLFLLALIPIYILQINYDTLVKSVLFFLLACIIFAGIILLNASFNYTSLGFNAFFYKNLLTSFKQNPIIVSMYYNLAIVLLAHFYHKDLIKIKAFTYIIIQLFFFSIVILLGSKIGYITLFISSVNAIIMLKINILSKSGLLLSIILASFIIYLKVPYVNHEVNGTIWQLTKKKHIILEHQLPRPIIFKSTIKTIKEHFFCGTGLGSSNSVLKEEFKEINYQKGINQNYNTHNQFLETFLEQGVIIFSILIILIFYSFYMAIYFKSYNYFLVALIFLLYMLVEAIFKSQSSIVIFTLFNSIMIKLNSQK